jgi:hypothetical protein
VTGIAKWRSILLIIWPAFRFWIYVVNFHLLKPVSTPATREVSLFLYL